VAFNLKRTILLTMKKFIKNRLILICFLVLNFIFCGDNGVNNSETYTVADTLWTETKDYDADSYTQYRKLNFNVDVSSGTHAVYVEIYHKLHNSSSYSLYYKTSDFEVTGISDSTWHMIGVGGINGDLPHNSYDFELRIYKSGSSKVRVTYGPTDDPDLNDQAFEPASEDTVKVFDL